MTFPGEEAGGIYVAGDILEGQQNHAPTLRFDHVVLPDNPHLSASSLGCGLRYSLVSAPARQDPGAPPESKVWAFRQKLAGAVASSEGDCLPGEGRRQQQAEEERWSAAQPGSTTTTTTTTTTKVNFRELSIRGAVSLVSCGEAHSLICTTQGSLFVHGSNANGQLGLGDYLDRLAPTENQLLEGIGVTMAAAGGFHSLVVTKDGQLMSFGSNSDGQLGLGKRRRLMSQAVTSGFESVCEPSLVTFDEIPELEATLEVMCLSAGYRHSAAVVSTWKIERESWFGKKKNLGAFDPFGAGEPTLLSEGELFTWGCNAEGQLGQPEAQGLMPLPCYVQLHPKVPRHEGLLPRRVGRDGDPFDDRLLRDKQVMSVACGGGHTLALTRDQCVYAWGRGRSGQLGTRGEVRDRASPCLVTSLKGEGVTQVSSQHILSDPAIICGLKLQVQG